MENIKIRMEDDTHVFIAEFDYYYVNIVVSLMLIHKRSAQTVTPTPQHYYQLGYLMGIKWMDKNQTG